MATRLRPAPLGSARVCVRSFQRVLTEQSLSNVAVLVDLVCPFVAVNQRSIQSLSILRRFLAQVGGACEVERTRRWIQCIYRLFHVSANVDRSTVFVN